MLSAEQALFYATALGGHSIILTGQGGTGKTFVLDFVAKDLASRGKNIAVTCSTGIAATKYEKGQTLHKWCGIGAGGIPTAELVKLICDDERYQDARKRIIDCHVLVVDEVSMISKKLFDTVEHICRAVRRNDKYFGGIQLILSGDFFQLPPVPDQLYGETGQYCFESKSFFNAVPHIIHLTTVFRQADGRLVTCINEIERGEPSRETIDYVSSLERDIPENDRTVYLFSTNFKASLYNHDKLKALPGAVKIYRSVDEGDSYYLNKFQAHKILGLKVDCSVMLVVNLSNALVNGTTGTVKELLDDTIIVHFQKPDITLKLGRYLFTKIDPVSRHTLSKRLQFPIILCYGITIHRSQGMTLESVVVDCENARIPGQIGVALGRAVAPETLQVKNFKSNLITQHPQKVRDFYLTSSKKLCPELTCCKNEYIPLELENELYTPFHIDLENPDSILDFCDDDDGGGIVDDDDDDDDDDEDDDLSSEELRHESASSMPASFSSQKPLPTPDYIEHLTILKSVSDEYINTPMQEQMCAIKETIIKNTEPFQIWLSSQFLNINRMAENNMPDGKTVETKNITKFCSDVNNYLKKDRFFESCGKMLSNYQPAAAKAGQFLCTSVCFSLQKIIIQKKSELVTTTSVQERQIPTEKFEEGKGSVRYIGGYCISKLRNKHLKKVQNSLFDPKKEGKLSENRTKSGLLLQLVVPFSDISKTTKYSETLQQTARKQNIREGLTNITDAAYLFFDKLNHNIRELETFQTLYDYGEKVIEYIKSKLLENYNLLQDWLLLFRIDESYDEDDIIVITSLLSEIYIDILMKYIKVSASYFRKDYLLFIKREKGKAHRKKVMEKSERKSTVKLTVKEIISDKSEGKKVSHLKLKACAVDNNEYFNDIKYLKKDLQNLCEAYDIPVSRNTTKKQLNDALINTITQCDSMLTPDAFTEVSETSVGPSSTSDCPPTESSQTITPDPPQRGGPGGKGKGKGKRNTKTAVSKGRSKKKKQTEKENPDEENNCCSVCFGKFDDSPNWIQCDDCDKWVHGECAGIITPEQWGKYETEDFYCPFCQ